tara:strand:+ start:259 stop:396 length:138 start_codon:yes stop_codon:yes gene_type:complete
MKSSQMNCLLTNDPGSGNGLASDGGASDGGAIKMAPVILALKEGP